MRKKFFNNMFSLKECQIKKTRQLFHHGPFHSEFNRDINNPRKLQNYLMLKKLTLVVLQY